MLEPKIEINHPKLLSNLDKIKTRLNDQVKIMAVVKSNAYGHGMAEVSKTLEKHVDMFGLGYLEEAIKLRKSIGKDILVMGPVYDFQEAIKNNIIIAMESMHQFRAIVLYYEHNLKGTDTLLRVHIKVDTGMHRFGLSFDELKDVLNIMENKGCHDNINVEGVFSHFAQTVNKNEKLVYKQYDAFKKVKDYMKKHFHKKIIYHIANSENALDTKDFQEDMVRIGNGLYGGMYLKEALDTERIGRIFLPIMSIHILKEDARFGYGFRARAKKGTRLGSVKTGFYEGMGMYRLPVGLGVLPKFKMLLRRVAKVFMRKEKVLYQAKKLPVVGMINMQFFQVNLTNTEIMVGDFVELTKEPLFYDDSVKRVHLLEGKEDEIDY